MGQEVGQEKSSPCGGFSLQQLERRYSQAPHIHKACGVVKDSCPQGMSWDRPSEKNSKQGRLTRSQLQQVNGTLTMTYKST